MATITDLLSAAETVELQESVPSSDDAETLLILNQVLPSFRLQWFPQGFMLTGVNGLLQYPFENVDTVAPDGTLQTTDMLLTFILEYHDIDLPECAPGVYTIPVEEYVTMMMQNTAVVERGINRGVLYLEFKYGGFPEEYPILSRNLSELIKIPGGLAMKRLIDYRHVLLSTNDVIWLYNINREIFERFMAENTNPGQILADVYITSFIYNDNGALKPTEGALKLLNIEYIANEDHARKLAEFRDFLWEAATKLYNETQLKLNTDPERYLDDLQRFWAMVMDYFMVLTICRDIQEYTFTQYVVLVGTHHQTAIGWFFGVPKLGSMAENGCVDLDGTAMLTVRE